MLYTASSPYSPQHPDEIELGMSHIVSILLEYDDGWCMAKNESTIKTGLLPMNFLTPVPEKQPSPPQLSIQPHIYETEQQPNSHVSPIILSSAISSKFSKKSLDPVVKPTKEELSLILEKIKTSEKNFACRTKSPELMGLFKIIVVGDSGIGKTDFIDAICSSRFIKIAADPIMISSGIVELSCSTITPPPPEISGEKLDREFNLSLYDTPGFGAHIDATLTIDPIISFLKAQFLNTYKYFNPTFITADSGLLCRLISSASGAHTHVNACVYGILHRLKPIDKEFMKVLSPFVPIIPVIVKSDTLDSAQVFKLKESILRELESAGIQVYSFGLSTKECLALCQHEMTGAIPFAISNEENSKMTNRINEMEDFKQKVMFTYSEQVRHEAALKFCKWKTDVDAIAIQKRLQQVEAPPIPTAENSQTKNNQQQNNYQQYNSINGVSQERRPSIPEYIPASSGGGGGKGHKDVDGLSNIRASVSYGGGRPQIGTRASSRPDMFKKGMEQFTAQQQEASGSTSAAPKTLLGFNYGSLKKAIQKKK